MGDPDGRFKNLDDLIRDRHAVYFKTTIALNGGGLVTLAALLTNPQNQFAHGEAVWVPLASFALGVAASLLAMFAEITGILGEAIHHGAVDRTQDQRSNAEAEKFRRMALRSNRAVGSLTVFTTFMFIVGLVSSLIVVGLSK